MTTVLINKIDSSDFSDTTEYLRVSREDLNLYFADTFLFFPDRNQYEYVHNFEIGEDGNPAIVTRFANRKENKCALRERQISFKFPEMGLYNFKAGVVFLHRKTMRQNKKGLCTHTIGVLNTLKLFQKFKALPTQFLLGQTWRFTIGGLNQLILKDKPLPLEVAFLKITRLKDFSRTLSRDFFVGQGIDSKAPSLWFRQTAIGSVVTKNKVVIKNPLFVQEALDFFLPQGVALDTEGV